MNNDTNINTVEEHEIFGDRDFPSWLTQQQISLACTTYQTNRLMLIGAAPETNRIWAFWRIVESVGCGGWLARSQEKWRYSD